MGQLYTNIAIGFDMYFTFFTIFIFNLLLIAGAFLPIGLITGFFANLYFKR